MSAQLQRNRVSVHLLVHKSFLALLLSVTNEIAINDAQLVSAEKQINVFAGRADKKAQHKQLLRELFGKIGTAAARADCVFRLQLQLALYLK